MSKKGLLSLEIGGDDNFSLEEVKRADNELEILVGTFYLKVAERARKLGVIDSGRMISKDNFKGTITPKGDITNIDFSMIEYADYVNRGVQGIKNSANAPESPYKFKNLGMSEEGRKSILKSVERGKMKVSDTSKTKYGLVGLEKKAQKTPNQKEINEKEAARIAYLIKAYGIKTTNFINDAWDDFVKELGDDLQKIITPKILAQLKIVNK